MLQHSSYQNKWQITNLKKADTLIKLDLKRIDDVWSNYLNDKQNDVKFRALIGDVMRAVMVEIERLTVKEYDYEFKKIMTQI